MGNLFIGLGGAGCEVVSELQNISDNSTNSNKTANNDYYLYVDTDLESISTVRERDNTYVIDLSEFRLIDYLHSSQRNEIESWFDIDNALVPQLALQHGSMVSRQLARMAWYYNPITNKVISNLFDEFSSDNKWAISNNNNRLDSLKIFVVTSSVGGTGSGIVFDLLYSMWRYYTDQKGFNGNLDVTGLIIMPDAYLDCEKDANVIQKFNLNAYAFLQELNALVKIGLQTNNRDQFYRYCPNERFMPTDQTWQPFQRVILVGGLNDRFRFTLSHLYSTLSEFIHTFVTSHKLYGNSIHLDESRSSFTVQKFLETTLINSEPDRNKDYVNFFSSINCLISESKLNESNENKDFEYFKNVDYPFLKLNEPIQAVRLIFKGMFQGNADLLAKIGYDKSDINHLLLESEEYKDKIIRISFYNKISLNDYFLFRNLESFFIGHYTKQKQESKIVATPFLHKDFKGDVYSVLNKHNLNN
jgi:hypothetical protein